MENVWDDTFFMKKALAEAQLALEKEEVPVGVVVVANNSIIARAHNLTETLNDVTAHAEMQGITAAANAIGGKYLQGCTTVSYTHLRAHETREDRLSALLR